jgi:imidazolonepropionase-like amidohydrolase
MGVVWEVRRAFHEAKASLERSDGERTRQQEVLAAVLQGRLQAVTTARSEQDIRTALRIAAEFGYRTAIDEAQDAYNLADELAALKTPVLVGAPSALKVGGTGAADGSEPRFSTIVALARRGVPFVVTTGTNPLALDLVREAMFAARYGLAPGKALDAVTIEPARLLGVDDRVGSLEVGKDADFVVWSCDPLDPAAVAVSVHVDGMPVPAGTDQ